MNDWDGETPGEPLLAADEIRALHGAGIEIGSHGATHRALTRLDDADLAREVAGSRETLERITGAPVTSFCYPYGDFDDRVVEAVRAAGYRAATVIRGGISKDLSDPFRLKRVAVRGTNTRLDFRPRAHAREVEAVVGGGGPLAIPATPACRFSSACRLSRRLPPGSSRRSRTTAWARPSSSRRPRAWPCSRRP